MAKVLVSIDDALLERIDEAARQQRLSRSAFLAGLAARELGQWHGPGAAPAVQAASRRLRRLFAEAGGGEPDEDVTDTIRKMRDMR